MLRFKVNGTEYTLPLSVADITLRQHLRMIEVEATAPDEFTAILDEKNPDLRKKKAARLPKVRYAKKILPFFARVISCASGVPVEILLGKDGHQGAPVAMLEAWYWKIQEAYLKWDSAQAKRQFEIDGKIWTLPEDHMAKSTFGEFAEAAQYEDYAADVAGGNWSKMPYVMAVLLKPEGEKFDPDTFDDIVEQRAEFMRGLTMDVVYSVSFFLLKRNLNSKIDSAIYTSARLLSTYKQASKTSQKAMAGT